MINNKKAIVFESLIFIILNILFFVVMLFFVYNAGSNDAVYEQSYAKQIALLVDNAKPEMAILFNINKLAEVARENKKSLNDTIKLNQEENKVIVSLRNSRGYSYKYFSDYDVKFNILEFGGNYLLSININEKK